MVAAMFLAPAPCLRLAGFGVLAGQTWTTLMDENTYADTIDFEGPVGVVATRRPQVRYSQAMGKNLTLPRSRLRTLTPRPS